MESENMASRLRLRPAERGDFERMLAVQRAAYALKEAPLYGQNLPPFMETPETLAEAIAGGTRIFVAEVDGEVVASMRVDVLEDGEAHWSRLSVDPALMGRKIAQTMLREAEALFADAPRFSLDCGERSVENRHIYLKHGYVETGESFQVPDGPRVLVMVKDNRVTRS